MTEKILLICIVAILPFWLQGQSPLTLTLEEVNARAASHYPLLRQKELNRRSTEISNSNIGKAYLPQVSLMAQATYQSAVTEVPVKIPAFTPEALSKDQYRAMLDVSQLIYDGGSTSQQKQMQFWNEKVEEQKIEVELQKLRERINTVYFSALMAGEQIKLATLTEKDIIAGMEKVAAQVKNGTAYRSALALLQAEKLKNDQRIEEWRIARKGLTDVLSEFTGISIPESATLLWPASDTTMLSDQIERSELRLLSMQDSVLQHQDRFIDVRNRPKLSAFIQGGYGRPGLDMLKNEFDFFYTTGLRVNWVISSLYTSRQDREMIEVNRRILEVQQSNFRLQTRAQMIQQASEIRKWSSLLTTDQEIIRLKNEVKLAAKAQLDNGIINSSDYMREVNAEALARQNEVMHRLLWVQAVVNYITITGK